MNERPVRVAGTGAYLPGEPVKFHDIESVLGELTEVTPDFQKWYKRTRNLMYQILGMENYYYAIDRETGACNDTCAGMSARAARDAIAMAGIEANDIDLIIYGGSSNDRFICPPTSAFIQQELGIDYCAEMSIHSNCTATYKALQVASDLIANGRYKTALVCSSNLVSSALKASYYNQAKIEKNQAILRWFLCDGAGAVVLKADEDGTPGMYFRDSYVESVGSKYPPHMYNSAGCSTLGALQDYEAGNHHVTQDYRDVSQLGPKLFIEGFLKFCDQIKHRLGEEEYKKRVLDATYFLVNVPTRHLIDLTADELKVKFRELREAKFDMYYSTTEKRGYTGPAAILLTLDKLLNTESFRDRETIVSFVTESSKWMNAGFVLEYRA
jgi:3-oxoacyl-[acyl-carrier-protein] synthase III